MATSPLRAFALDLSPDESDGAPAPPPRETAARLEATGEDAGSPWSLVVSTFDDLLCRVQAEVRAGSGWRRRAGRFPHVARGARMGGAWEGAPADSPPSHCLGTPPRPTIGGVTTTDAH